MLQGHQFSQRPLYGVLGKICILPFQVLYRPEREGNAHPLNFRNFCRLCGIFRIKLAWKIGTAAHAMYVSMRTRFTDTFLFADPLAVLALRRPSSLSSGVQCGWVRLSASMKPGWSLEARPHQTSRNLRCGATYNDFRPPPASGVIPPKAIHTYISAEA